MKLVLTADWHIRSTPPLFRKDHYMRTLISKVEWILELAQEKQAIVIQAGDFFDKSSPSYSLVSGVVELLLRYASVPVYCVYGQHDLSYHAKRTTTALNLLDKAGVVKILEPQVKIGLAPGIVNLWGCSYNQSLDSLRCDSSGFNVLVMHKMMIKMAKIWKGQKDYLVARSFLNKHRYDLVVSGDNHKFFIEHVGKKVLVNPGSLGRSTVAQMNHKPRVVLFDTKTKKYEILEIPVGRPSAVFDINLIEDNIKITEKLETFVEKLVGKSELDSLDFLAELKKYMNRKSTPEAVKKYIGRMIYEDE